ncbi:MAG: rRNA maturation RNAse YbeY, partial [Aquabacterium sp.]|uniref:rRNA maturation RNAse YbeY n=1 Tax=Aquabacterium sp. TaxID=1872578 RepID=UPI003BB0079F
AAQYENDFFYELAFYLCHGVLHLMGYSDQTKRQAHWMGHKQEAVLKGIGVGKKWRFRKIKELL